MKYESAHTVSASAEGFRLDVFAAGILGCGIRAAKRLAAEGRILVEGKPRPPQFKLVAGTVVAIVCVPAAQPSFTIRLAAAGTAYAAFIKPPGLHTAAIAGKTSPSLEQTIRDQWTDLRRAPVSEPSPRMPEFLAEALGGCLSTLPPLLDPLPPAPPVLLSRLDEQTSGLVAAAFTKRAAEDFRAMETAGSVDKYYLAIVRGTVGHAFCMKNFLDTDNRKTTRVLPEENPDPTRHTAVFPLPSNTLCDSVPGPGKTLVVAHIRRGARHQIRAHLAHAGFPLLGDPLYGTGGDNFLYLHHARIVFPGFTAACLPSWFFMP